MPNSANQQMRMNAGSSLDQRQTNSFIQSPVPATNQSINRSINQSLVPAANQAIKQSINQSSLPAANQSVNQSRAASATTQSNSSSHASSQSSRAASVANQSVTQSRAATNQPLPADVSMHVIIASKEKTARFILHDTMTVLMVKNKLFEAWGVPVKQQVLIFGRSELEHDENTLKHYKIAPSPNKIPQLFFETLPPQRPLYPPIPLVTALPRLWLNFSKVVTVLRSNKSAEVDEKPIAGEFEIWIDNEGLQYSDSRPLGRMIMTFYPTIGRDGLKPGDQVRFLFDRKAAKSDDLMSGRDDVHFIGSTSIVFLVPVSSPARDLVVNFSDENSVKQPQCSFQLTLQRSLPDFGTELRLAIAAYATISVCDIVSVECDGVDLSDRYEVANLKRADVIDVTIEVGVSPRVTMLPLAIVPLARPIQRGRKRAHSDEDDEDENESASDDVKTENDSENDEQNSDAESDDTYNP